MDNFWDLSFKFKIRVTQLKNYIQTRSEKAKQSFYKIAVVIDLLFILGAFTHESSIIYQLSLPLISPLSVFRTFAGTPSPENNVNTYELFRFIPGWSFARVSKVHLEGVKTLAYFDVPVQADGTLYRDVDGYQVFRSEKALAAFQEAQQQGARVLLTISQTDPKTIKELLDSSSSQKHLISEAITEVQETGIDGVTINFEYIGDDGASYAPKLNAFMKALTAKMHQEVKNSYVVVALPNSAAKQSFYDLETLAKTTDKVFMVAYDFSVPEYKNNALIAPLYGFDQKDYWQEVSTATQSFLPYIPQEKLVLETAWYGNGDNYPIYTSNTPETKPPQSFNELKTPLDQATLDRLVLEVPRSARGAARRNLPLIAKALEDEGILDSNVLAYALATIEHETAGTFEPIEEYKGRKSARRLGYEGGTNYFGRGFIQLTHLRNYKRIGERIGMGEDLVKNPELALNPEISAKILAAFFKDNGIARLARMGDFIDARTPINPDYQGGWIATLAYKYLYTLG